MNFEPRAVSVLVLPIPLCSTPSRMNFSILQ